MIYESGEDYLETILLLQRKNGSVRSIEIAAELGYTKASVSRAMSILRENAFITMEAHGAIRLTEKGETRAKAIYERHQLIARYFTEVLGVEKTIADRDACRIEHVMSEETFSRLKAVLEEAERAFPANHALPPVRGRRV